MKIEELFIFKFDEGRSVYCFALLVLTNLESMLWRYLRKAHMFPESGGLGV
jgi:hypothetical protein